MLLKQLCKSCEDADRIVDAEAAIDVLDFIINDCYRADFRITQLTLLCSRFLSLYQQLTVQAEHYPHCSSVSVGIVSDIRSSPDKTVLFISMIQEFSQTCVCDSLQSMIFAGLG